MDGSSADLYTVSVQIWADTSRIGRPSADTPATADLQRGISSVHGMALPSILQVVAATTVSTKCYVQQFESLACNHQYREGSSMVSKFSAISIKALGTLIEVQLIRAVFYIAPSESASDSGLNTSKLTTHSVD